MDTKKPFKKKNAICDHSSVIVSGIGVISAAGSDVDANFANMSEGKRFPKVAPTVFDCDFSRPIFECDSTALDPELLPYKRTLALALKAVDEALNDAKFTEEDLKNRTVGVCIGTTVACTLNNLDFYSKVRDNKKTDLQPLQRYVDGNIAQNISANFALKGPIALVANACASGTNAIAIAYSWIQSGLCDIAIAGGADELNLIPYCGFNSLQVMSETPCLPFDPEREGLNLGEGAGILILESESSAIERGVNSEITLASCGGASDAFHLTGPHPEGDGLFAAVTSALQRASLTVHDIDYINAHGTATLENDKIEALVFNRLSTGTKHKYSSIKYYTGHTLGAAGAIEAAICIKGMREGHFPGVNGTGTIPYNGNAVLSTSMAFGGSCSALLFTKRSNSIKTEQSTIQKVISTHVKIATVGILGSFGHGIDDLKNAIHANAYKECTTRLIPEEALKDPAFKRIRRRADKLSLSMLTVAKDAIRSSALSEDEIAKTAIIAATGFGAQNTTFKFLNDMLDFGQMAPSPTLFSNSVHNAPSFYITQLLKIKGLSVTFTGFYKPFTQAFNYATALIKSGEYENVLLVAGDEVCEPMLKMSKLWYESKKQSEPVWGEGAVAFLLTKTEIPSEIEPKSPVLPVPESKIEEIFGKTLINDAFKMALDVITAGK